MGEEPGVVDGENGGKAKYQPNLDQTDQGSPPTTKDNSTEYQFHCAGQVHQPARQA